MLGKGEEKREKGEQRQSAVTLGDRLTFRHTSKSGSQKLVLVAVRTVDKKAGCG